MSSPRKPLVRRLTRAYERGASWNWYYWKAVVRCDGREITLASVPPRYVHEIEAGRLTKAQATQILASQNAPTLEGFTPYVPLWNEALSRVLDMRIDARRAALFGLTALDLAREGKWFEAFEACWAAAEIERAYSGRVVRWRPMLYLLASQLVASEHEHAGDERVRSTAEASARASRSRHAGRGRD